MASLPTPLVSPALLPLRSSGVWSISSPISKDSSFLGCSRSAGMADISLLEFYLVQHLPKMTPFLIAGTSAERLGKMQYLVSSPLCVTFARAGLFLGPTASYRWDSRKGSLSMVTSADYFHSPRWTRWTLYTWCIVASLKETRVTGITSKGAGNILGQKDRLTLAPPELRQQQRSTNIYAAYLHKYMSLHLQLQDND